MFLKQKLLSFMVGGSQPTSRSLSLSLRSPTGGQLPAHDYSNIDKSMVKVTTRSIFAHQNKLGTHP